MFLKFFNPIDKLINGVSMYRLLLYYLVGLLIVAIGLSAVKDMHYSPIQIGLSAIIAVIACWIINLVFARIFEAPINPESSILTGLIIALIIPPTLNNFGILFVLAASGLAIASKYILTIGQKHIFNPAAIAVVLTYFGSNQGASWWMGTAMMLPFVLIGGILITRKLRKEHMVITFLVVTAITTAVYSVIDKSGVLLNLKNMTLSSPAFFLAFVMLTEPYTSPTTRNKQLVYAGIVGFLIAPQVHLGSVYTTPEIGLVIGNIFAYLVSSKTKLFPILKNKIQIARDTVEFEFLPGKQFAFEPGQYMEFTLPHENPDNRGSRRWFTIASSPTEPTLKIGVKFYEQSSSFKEAMLDINQNSQIVAAQIAGDFVLPNDPAQKLVFIAGGIGVTPFRSMVKYLIDNRENRSVRMLYAVKTKADIAYKDVFEEARSAIGMKTLYVLSGKQEANENNMINGLINKRLLQRAVPDYEECLFYISGTHDMVESVELALLSMGVHHHNIKMDFFSGYA